MNNVRYRAMLNVMWNTVVCCDARCKMWLWNTEWCGMFDATLQGVKWLKMQCAMCGVVWNGCCGNSVIYM